jgi:uncharacterized repeat protein (TIGR03803 family)
MHGFANYPTDGAGPNGNLTLVGSALYGMTYYGGSNGIGTVFGINTNGTGYTSLHSFVGGTSDGSYPNGSLTLVGSTLYGMTSQDGSSDQGTIFKINTDGNGFTIVHSFGSITWDGHGPKGSLTLVGSSLFGMTEGGGPSGNGVVFSLTPSQSYLDWQMEYFGCTNCPEAAPGADLLGKGMSNTNQFLAGLNPTNPASVFKITSSVPTGANYVVTWKAAGIRTNVVQAGSSMVGSSFQTISGPIIINVVGDTTTNYTDVGGATNKPSRFYRIRLVP